MMSFLSPGSKINSQTMIWDPWKKLYPEKFPAADEIFARIHPGARIFIGTACGEPQALTRALVDYVQIHPGALFDAELIQVWTLGITPYAEGKFPENFRLNSSS